MTGDITRTDHPADPLASSFAVLLRGPLTELYALLWRAGVLDVVGSDTQKCEPGRPTPQLRERAAG
ncbi:hypothetical protein A5634_26005 [Mycobacterium asiaticum]|uniref:Uncharacterized protein n=1 Tax=Mycobacterium asiaticum TaxID=1790 RepID=A0A1A3NZP0_MYCAS|nr:Rv1535 domain-containing protein [Mycobacterium asiaticum]OBK25817.1 hypothetical protein A5634_26005 [Mycobacterium asiaticum]